MGKLADGFEAVDALGFLHTPDPTDLLYCLPFGFLIEPSRLRQNPWTVRNILEFFIS
jgi:hypothetical protein